MNDSLFVTPHLTIPGTELSFRAVRASGPGGQNVNKVSSKVELRFDFERSSALDDYTKARLRALAYSRLDSEGRLVITSQATRDRQRNVEDARAKLAELVAQASHREKRRRATAPTRASNRRRLDEKRRSASRKGDRSVPKD